MFKVVAMETAWLLWRLCGCYGIGRLLWNWSRSVAVVAKECVVVMYLGEG